MRGNENKKKINKAILSFLVFFFVLSNFYFFLFVDINPANAQVQMVIDSLLSSIQTGWKGLEFAKFTKDEVLDDLKATFFKNVVANLGREFAKKTASSIVLMGKGQKPIWETDPYGAIKDQGQAAFEDWLTGAVSQGIGLDLCHFDPTLTLNIALTLPNKPDTLAQKSIFGAVPKGCSFLELKEQFNFEGKEWQDFIKIKTTDIGPNFQQTVSQINRDITSDSLLAGTSAKSDLTAKAAALDLTRQQLDADVDKLIAGRGTNQPVTLTVGSNYYVSEEYIPDIKSAWNKKINDAQRPVNTSRATYQACMKKDATGLINQCKQALMNVGYTTIPTAAEVAPGSQAAGIFQREAQAKLQDAANLYNSISNGYEQLQKFVNNRIQAKMFRGAGLYTYQKAKTQFEPQADPANTTKTQVQEGTGKAQTEAEERKKTEVSTSGGWKGMVDKVTGYIKTPADILKAKSIQSLTPSDSMTEYTKSIVADSLGVFLQELYNLYINELMMALSNPRKQKENKGSIFVKENQSIITESGVSLYFTSFEPGTNNEFSDLDLLQEFQLNLQGKNANPNIYNQVIDQSFAMAIQNRLTIDQALSQGKLKSGATFSWGEEIEDNTYNLSNIRKLRKARVVPLGMELAAELVRDCNFRKYYNPCQSLGLSSCLSITNLCSWSADNASCVSCVPGTANCAYTASTGNDFGQFIDLSMTTLPISPYAKQRIDNCKFGTDIEVNKLMYNQVVNATFGEIVTAFDKRGQDGICGNYDTAESPFCNLVDPYWVLKIPATKCYLPTDARTLQVESFGELLTDNQSGRRYSRCADFVSCVKDDQPKSCGSSNYQVCVKEKNVWRFSAKACPDYFSSCRTYTQIQSNGREADLAYLKNTLDPSNCGPDTVNCKGYKSIDKTYNLDKFYFNRNIETCEEKNDGCHEYIANPTTISDFQATGFVLPASYDQDVLATRVYYKTSANCDSSSPTRNDCNNFMMKCSSDDVGCALYQPVNGDPDVTAVIQEDDQCPAECVGYNQYIQQPTAFEPIRELADFVPKTATTCQAANVGCSQFTNLDEVAKGGEGIEYYTMLRQCIKPGSGLGEQTFYTWESISDGPQQVVKHVLQANGDGSPKTFDNSEDCRSNVLSTGYCLKFYDSAGNTYFRDVRKTIIASADCHPYRKTIATQETCGVTNGKWDETNKYCVYDGISSLSMKCPAAQAGCYHYYGAGIYNTYHSFNDTFEDSVNLPTQYSGPGISLSSASQDAGGHSLEIAAYGSAVRQATLSKGNYYILQFTAKGNGTLRITNFGETELLNTWNMYQLGPIYLNSSFDSITFNNVSGTDVLNLDNISLIQQKDNYYLIKNSWSQPNCTYVDYNCAAYRGPNSQMFYLKSFSKLCAADKVGCQYLIDTQNSLAPNTKTSLNIAVPSDVLTAYVVNQKFKCTYENKGCQKFEEPVLTQGSGVVYDVAYLKNNPDNYEGARAILCNQDAEGCVELINENGSPEYYKIDPTKICQYQANKPIEQQTISGWFVAGTEIGCNTMRNQPDCSTGSTPCSYCGGIWVGDLKQCGKGMSATGQADCENQHGIWLSSGAGLCVANPFGILKVTDTGYINYTGECQSAYSGCSSFQTINQDQSSGQIYHVIDNGNNIDRSSCSSVDWNKGCVAFKNQTSNNNIETIKVSKDRDCGEWVICSETDRLGNCRQTQVITYNSEGTTEISKTINTGNTDPLIHSNFDGVRYTKATPSAPLKITRATYVTRFAGSGTGMDDAIKRWELGDYSGYTIPDRYPVEVEINDGYLFAKYPVEYTSVDPIAEPDQRFISPVCKIFPEEDSPLPYDISRLSKYSKVVNLFSPTLTLKNIADGCNYDKAEATGTITYFPYGFLNKIISESNNKPQICTGNKAVEGRLCQGVTKNNPQCVIPLSEENTDEKIIGQCSAVETIKTNLGFQGRCLEYDLLNPLYGGIYREGANACLTYFPFKIDECGLLKNKTKCELLPYCAWNNGQCIKNVCDYHKNKTDCEKDVTESGQDMCTWDEATATCLFNICSLTTPNINATEATKQKDCESLATYCSYFNHYCMEDICTYRYSGLGTTNIDSHGPRGEICMTQKADYCSWNAYWADKDRWRWSCNLQCDKKYPAAVQSLPVGTCKDAGGICRKNLGKCGSNEFPVDNKCPNNNFPICCLPNPNAKVCNDDKFCQWRPDVCRDTCNLILDPAGCNTNCSWNEQDLKCENKCIEMSTTGLVTAQLCSGVAVGDPGYTYINGQCQASGSCAETDILSPGIQCTAYGSVCCKSDITPLTSNACKNSSTCEVGEDYLCTSACETKYSEDTCNEAGNDGCYWDFPNQQCVNLCTTIQLKSACQANDACNWKAPTATPAATLGDFCEPKTTCDYKINLDQQWFGCLNQFGCEPKAPACVSRTDCSVNTSQADCDATLGLCSWTTGICVDRFDSSGCAKWTTRFLCSRDPKCFWGKHWAAGTYAMGCIIKEDTLGCEEYDEAAPCVADSKCKMVAYTYSNTWLPFCMPTQFNPDCHMCNIPNPLNPGSRCEGSMCN
ncbi:MAG: hypothetical protein NTZ49_02720 [Candidatus Parcubacteria bacterium]|nr:hypothetical protein [Candidatus Parcubacteria bacterium]